MVDYIVTGVGAGSDGLSHPMTSNFSVKQEPGVISCYEAWQEREKIGFGGVKILKLRGSLQ